MNKIYLLLIILILIVGGCSQQTVCNKPYILVGNDCCLDANYNNICDDDEQTTEEIEEETQVEDVEEETETESPSEPVQEVVQEHKEEDMDNGVKELLIKAKTKVNSYSYTYFGPPDESHGIDFTYKYDTLKMHYPTMQRDDRQNPYDTVYLYLDSKNAVGYCEKIGACSNPDLEIELKYADHYKVMPLEILDTITFAVEKGSERIDNRDATILEFEDRDGQKGEISIDEYWGMPLKIIYKEPKSYKIEYTRMAVNSIKDSDITH